MKYTILLIVFQFIIIINFSNSDDFNDYKYNSNSKNYVLNASRLKSQGKISESILELMEALRYDSSATISYLIAKNYFEIEKLEAARDFAYLSIKLDSNYSDSYELLGYIFFSLGKNQIALKYLDKSINLDDKIDRRLNKAYILELIDTNLAIQCYTDLLDKFDNTFIYEKLINLYLSKSDLDNALFYSKKYFNEENSNRSFWLYLNILFKFENYSESLNFIINNQKKLDIQLLSDSFLEICNRFSNLDTLDFEFYNKLISNIDSRFYYDSLLINCSCYLSAKYKDTSRFENFINRLNKITNDISKVIEKKLYIYYNLNDTTKFLDAITNNEDLILSNNSLFYQLAYILIDLKINTLSLKLLNKFLIKDSTSVDIYLLFAYYYEKNDDIKNAEKNYIKALFLEPDNDLINNNYAYFLVENNMKLDEAFEMSKKTIEKNPYNYIYLDTFGWINYKIGDLNKAEEYLLKSLENCNEPNDLILEHLGILYFELGKLEKSLNFFEKSLEINNNNKISLNYIEKIKNK